MIIMLAITVMLTLQNEIGLVSSNTMRWLIFILMVITIIAVLITRVQRRRATWPAEVISGFGGLDQPQPQE
jgi:hypothetical protein